MKHLLLAILILLSMSVSGAKASLDEIKNYRQLSATVSSAGLPTDAQIADLQKAGFNHVINLIPGDYSAEQALVTAAGMSFEQIEVDWNNPTLEDFARFSDLMDQYSDGKTLVHCKLNYRASAFVYLYQLIKDKDVTLAEQQMQSIWQDVDNWDEFMTRVKAAHSK